MTLLNLASIHPAPKSGSLSHHSRLTTPLGLIEFSIRWLWSIATNPLLELTFKCGFDIIFQKKNHSATGPPVNQSTSQPLTTHHYTITPLDHYTTILLHQSTTHDSPLTTHDLLLTAIRPLNYTTDRLTFFSFLHRPIPRCREKQIPKALGTRLIFMSLKTTKAAPPRKANRFTSALLLYPFFTTFLFSKFHKK